MRVARHILLGSLSAVALQLLWSGCAGYVGGDGGGVYYGGNVWFQDDAWVDGGRGWYGHHDSGAYVHPSGNDHPSGNNHPSGDSHH